MNSNNKVAWLRSIITLGLMLAVFVSSSMFVLAAPTNKSLAGEIIITGDGSDKSAVTLNGERVYSGRTFFSSGVIATPETSSAMINLGKLGRISIAPNSLLSLSLAENSISGKLSAGQIKVFSNEGVSVNIETIDNAVKNDASQNGIFTVSVQTGVTQANAESGMISTKNESNLPSQPQTGQTAGVSSRDVAILFAVFAGIVGAVAYTTLIHEGEEEGLQSVSPVR
jgi:hypothetical protein